MIELPEGFLLVAGRIGLVFLCGAGLVVVMDLRARFTTETAGRAAARRSLWPRYRVWCVASLLILAAGAAGPGGVAVLTAALAYAAATEMGKALEQIGLGGAPPRLLQAAVMLPIVAAAAAGGDGLALGLAATLMILPVTFWRHPPTPERLRAAAAALVSVLYVGGGLGCLVLVREAPHGFGMFMWVILVVALNDVVAMFGGLVAGRRPLLRAISPSKTAEGTAIGLLGGLCAALLVLPALPPTPWWSITVATLALSVCGIVGDLVASWIKRAAGIKDFSGALPGHGGVLDRIDSLLYAAPAAVPLIGLLRS